MYYDTVASNSSLVNTTAIDYAAPLKVGWICPSIAPRTNHNSGWAVYQVDSATFSIINSQNYFANISNSHSVLWNDGPQWALEYDTRATYDAEGYWPAEAPLNASFWNYVTAKMMNDSALVDRYSFLQSKSSSQVPISADEAFRQAVICTIRSGSAGEAALCG